MYVREIFIKGIKINRPKVGGFVLPLHLSEKITTKNVVI
jgi:hypothetical protein